MRLDPALLQPPPSPQLGPGPWTEFWVATAGAAATVVAAVVSLVLAVRAINEARALRAQARADTLAKKRERARFVTVQTHRREAGEGMAVWEVTYWTGDPIYQVGAVVALTRGPHKHVPMSEVESIGQMSSRTAKAIHPVPWEDGYDIAPTVVYWFRDDDGAWWRRENGLTLAVKGPGLFGELDKYR